MENILHRIKQFSDSQGLSLRKLEESIGASNGVIGNALRKNSDIQSKWVSRIIETYENLNPLWLISGKGEMLRDSTIKNEYLNNFVKEPYSEYILNENKLSKNDIVNYLKGQIDKMQKEINGLYGQIAVLEHKLSNYENKQ